jgi:hypothetical protein
MVLGIMRTWLDSDYLLVMDGSWREYSKGLRRSMNIALDLVFLLPCHKIDVSLHPYTLVTITVRDTYLTGILKVSFISHCFCSIKSG